MRRNSKILAAAVLGLLSPLFCLAAERSALDIYAADAARELDAYAAKVAAQQKERGVAGVAVSAAGRGDRRGLEVNNASGIMVEVFAPVPGKAANHVGVLSAGEKSIFTCRCDKMALVFKGAGGYEARVEAQFSPGSVNEVRKTVLPKANTAEKEAYRKYVDRVLYKYSFVDVLGGVGKPAMSLEFSNSNNNIYLSQLSIGGPTNGPYNSVKMKKLKTSGFGLVGARLGGYGAGHLGAALELGMEKRNIKRQTTSFSLDGGAAKKLTFNSGDYLTVTSVYAVADILFRFTKRTRLEPYIGVGGGLSFNKVVMPYVGGLQSSSSQALTIPTKVSGLGFVFNVPVGLRVQLTDGIQVVTEARYQRNTFVFDRGGINGERDILTVGGMYYNVGLSVNF